MIIGKVVRERAAPVPPVGLLAVCLDYAPVVDSGGPKVTAYGVIHAVGLEILVAVDT